MKRLTYNPVYLFAIICVFVLIYFIKIKSQENIIFYGVAINKEIQVKNEQNIRVDRIFVKQGQRVKKGDVLLIVSQGELINELSNNRLRTKESELINLQNVTSLDSELNSLNVISINQLKQLDIQIQQLESEKKNKTQLITQFSEVDEKKLDFSDIDHQISLLQTQKKDLLESSQLRKKLISDQIHKSKELKQIQSAALKNTTSLLENKVTQLEILAPEDGIVGNIWCVEGENVPSFQLLLTISETTPSMIQGYIFEDIKLNPLKGDHYDIKSIRDENQLYEGKINEIGSRLVEIPPRLRKIQEIITYGRDVTIEIPKDNKLLQNEKVTISLSKK